VRVIEVQLHSPRESLRTKPKRSSFSGLGVLIYGILGECPNKIPNFFMVKFAIKVEGKFDTVLKGAALEKAVEEGGEELELVEVVGLLHLGEELLLILRSRVRRRRRKRKRNEKERKGKERQKPKKRVRESNNKKNKPR
jgi:hypothetical protein